VEKLAKKPKVIKSAADEDMWLMVAEKRLYESMIQMMGLEQ
jgi:hypothetical protein